jgi:hypothetical protein
MTILWEIGLQTIEILTLVIGMFGMTFSLLLLFSPAVVRNLSRLSNRSVDIDRRLSFLDKGIRTDGLFYGHPVLVGICLVAGSTFALIFFFFRLDVFLLARILFGASDSIAGEILFESLAWFGKIACLIGLAAGGLLLVAPERMRRIEARMSSWVETRSLIEKLERPNHQIDALVWRHPVFFGLLGASVSCLLIVLSILNLLR